MFEPRRQELECEAQEELSRRIADAERAAADDARAMALDEIERGRAQLLAEYGEDRESFAAALARLDAERGVAELDAYRPSETSDDPLLRASLDAQVDERRRLEDAVRALDDGLQDALAKFAQDTEERMQSERLRLEEEAVRSAEERIKADLERDLGAAAAAATQHAETVVSHHDAELRTSAELHGREAEAVAIAQWTDGYAERAAVFSTECEAHHHMQAASRLEEDEARIREDCVATAQRQAEAEAEGRRAELLSDARAAVAKHAEELASSAEAEARQRIEEVVAQTHEAALARAGEVRDAAHDAIDRQSTARVEAAVAERDERVRVAADVARAEGERIRADGRTHGMALAEQIKAPELDKGYALLRSFFAKHKLAFVDDIEAHIAHLAAQDWSELPTTTMLWLDTEFGVAEDGAERVRLIAATIDAEADAFMKAFDESRHGPMEPLRTVSPGDRAGKIADMVSDLFQAMPKSRRNAAGKMLGRGLGNDIGDMLPPPITDSDGRQIFGFDSAGREIPCSARGFAEVWQDALSSSNAAQNKMAGVRQFSNQSQQARLAGNSGQAEALHQQAAERARSAYEDVLGGFWRRIRDKEHRHLRALFEDGFHDRDGNKIFNYETGGVYDGAGMDFNSRKSGAPVYRLSDGTLEGVTLEHHAEKALDPLQAVQVENLLFSLRHENSWILQKMRDITPPLDTDKI